MQLAAPTTAPKFTIIDRRAEPGALINNDHQVEIAKGGVTDIRDRSITNPLHLLTGGELSVGPFTPSFFDHRSTRAVETSGNAALQAAITGLTELAGSKGVNGVIVDNVGPKGLVSMVGGIGYEGSTKLDEQLGVDYLTHVTQSAREVLALLDGVK
ncbi:MAG: hypothetical protein JWN72_1793 [Thermoleophilia bacterium]|nr:hypothetical protein [Thermoleophilia bacterium]